MGTLKTKVQISGTTIFDDSDGNAPSLLINWEYERTNSNGISELVMNVLRATNDTVALGIGKTVSIWKGFTTSTDEKIFEGFISEFSPDGGIIKIVCKDKMWDLIRKNVNEIYLSSGAQAGQVSAIAKDLIETHGGLTSDEQATGTEVGRIINEFRCVHTDIYERLMALAKAVNYQIWYDAANDTVHFEPRGFNASGETLTVGTEIIGVPKWENDTDRMINDLRVDGAVHETNLRFPTSGVGEISVTSNFTTTGITLPKTPESVKLTIDAANPPTTIREGGGEDSSTTNFFFIDKENSQVKPATGTTFTANHFAFVDYTWLAPAPVHGIRQESIDDHGSFVKEITLPDVITIADAESRMNDILDRFSLPFLIGDLLVKSVSTITTKVGDSVAIVDSINKPNINQLLVVTKQIIKYPGSNQELEVGDEAIRLADWQFDVDARLKRLEEGFIQNQDLLLELVDIRLSETLKPRYRKIIKETMADGSNFILGHSVQGLLGSDVLGRQADVSTNHFIQQFENSYTEDFFDTDFFDDPNSTGDWLTGVITSGQTLRSSSIDFNNGVVSSATATFTESGAGTPTFYLSADGGSNWETVTSGTSHSFSNTGTSLKWRIDSASGTTTVTKVIINNYH